MSGEGEKEREKERERVGRIRFKLFSECFHFTPNSIMPRESESRQLH